MLFELVDGHEGALLRLCQHVMTGGHTVILLALTRVKLQHLFNDLQARLRGRANLHFQPSRMVLAVEPAHGGFCARIIGVTLQTSREATMGIHPDAVAYTPEVHGTEMFSYFASQLRPERPGIRMFIEEQELF